MYRNWKAGGKATPTNCFRYQHTYFGSHGQNHVEINITETSVELEYWNKHYLDRDGRIHHFSSDPSLENCHTSNNGFPFQQNGSYSGALRSCASESCINGDFRPKHFIPEIPGHNRDFRFVWNKDQYYNNPNHYPKNTNGSWNGYNYEQRGKCMKSGNVFGRLGGYVQDQPWKRHRFNTNNHYNEYQNDYNNYANRRDVGQRNNKEGMRGNFPKNENYNNSDYKGKSKPKRNNRNYSLKKAHKCTKCAKYFTNQAQLTMHEKSAHLRSPVGNKSFEAKFKTENQGEKTGDKVSIKKEPETPESERPPTQLLTTNSNSTPKSLPTIQKPFQCSLCPKTFLTGRELERHGQIHTPPVKP